MKLDATQTALVAIAERRNQAVKARDGWLSTDQNERVNWAYEAGIVGGLQIALDILREARDENGDWVFPVASAEYLASR